MGVTEIKDIQISLEGENYIYDVSAEEGCSGQISILLSKVNGTDPEQRVESSCEWYNESGTLTVKKAELEKVSDLYLYIKDETTQTTSTIVKVYFEPCMVTKWSITEQREFLCYTEWGKSAYEFSTGIEVHFIDKLGMEKWIRRPMQERRIPLEDLGITEDVECVKLQVAYYMDIEGARVTSAYSDWFVVVVSPQKADKAIYAKNIENNLFYICCEDIETFDFTKDIEITLSTSLPEGVTYEGSCFLLQNVEGKSIFTIRKEIYSTDATMAKEDYQLLVKKIDEQKELIGEVKQMVLKYMPMRQEDMLFYSYGYEPDSGCMDIQEGMRLQTEYTLYQNVPNTKQSTADLSGYAGTGTACYQVVARNGKLQIDSFASTMHMQVDPPKEMASDNRLCGGAGVADLLYQGFSAEYMKLVYPVKFTERNSTGDLRYDRNICLLSAASKQKLTDAADNMRKNALSVDGVAYHYFRGRSVVIPQILVSIGGSLMWVSVGTTLGDVWKMLGKEKGNLYRLVAGEKAIVINAIGTLPLIAGDYVE